MPKQQQQSNNNEMWCTVEINIYILIVRSSVDVTQTKLYEILYWTSEYNEERKKKTCNKQSLTITRRSDHIFWKEVMREAS